MNKETLLNKKIFTILFGLAIFFVTQSTTLAVSSSFSISPESAQVAAKSLINVGNSTTITAGDGTKPTVTLVGIDQNGSKIIKISGLPESNYIQFRYDDAGNYMYDQTAFIPGSTSFSNVGDTRTFISEAGNGSEEITKLNTDGTKTVRRLYAGATKAYEYNINSSGVPVGSIQLSNLTLTEEIKSRARNASIIAGGVVGQKLQNAIKGMVGVGRYVPGTDARIDDLINNYVTGPTLSPLDETSLGTNFEVTTTNKAGIVNGSADQVDGGLCTLWDNDGGWMGMGGKLLSNKFSLFNCFEQLLYMGLVMVSWLVAMVGYVFNQIFTYTVTDMAVFVRSAGVIDGGWTAVRDMANILFIFILLYLAIATILQLDEHGVKHGLSRLIVAAMLVNFSLFFVKTVVDFSNRLAHSIYSQILDNGTSGTSTTITSGFPSIGAGFKSDAKLSWGLGDAVMGIFNFQNAFGMDQSKLNNTTSGAILGEQAKAFASSNNSFTTFLMGIIMMLVIIFIFLAVIIIFVKRMVVLMFLMVFSPLGFAGMAIPNHGIEHSIQHKFWGTLFKEAFYAPVFFIIIYLGLSIANSPGFKQLVVVDSGSFFGIGVVISYLVVIYTFIAALVAAEEIGVQGANGAMSVYSGLKDKVVGGGMAWATTNTIGRMARTTLQKGQSAVDIRDAAAGLKGKNPFSKFLWQQGGKATVSVLGNLSKGFDEKVHKQEEAMEATIHEAHGDPVKLAQILATYAGQSNRRSGLQGMHKIFDGMSPDQRVSAGLHLEDAAKGDASKGISDMSAVQALKTLYAKDKEGKDIEHGHGRSSPQDQAKMARIELEGTEYHVEKLKNAIESILSAKNDKEKNEGHRSLSTLLTSDRFRTEAQIVNTLRSLPPSHQKTLNESPEILKTMTTAIGPKVSSESFFASVGKDSIIGLNTKATIADLGYKAVVRKELFNIFTGDKGNVAKTDKEMKRLFIKEISVLKDMKELLEGNESLGLKDWKFGQQIDDESLNKAITKDTNIEDLIKMYSKKQDALDKPTHKYMLSANGERSQIMSEASRELVKAVNKLVDKLKTKPKEDQKGANTPPQAQQADTNPGQQVTPDDQD